MSYDVGDAVLVAETLQGGRRAVELAVETGDAVTVRLWPRVASEASERLLAHAVQAVVVQLRPEGWRRHDVVLYDVSRGELDRFELGLPPGVEVDEVATDEGPVAAVADAGALALHRTERLRSAGYAVVSSALDPAARRVELAGLRPAVEVRATYLVVAGSVAADVEPAKRDSWSRADLDDLPATLGVALGAVDLVAAWRLVPGEEPGGLRIEPLPEAPSAANVVARRDSTTLMTVDGTLLHRDVLEVSRAGSALEIELPAGSTLWSAKVAGQAVRPVERAGSLSVPLAFGGSGTAVVEVVSVSARRLPAGRSVQELELPRLSAQVLDHRWQVLLPERARYRVRESTLGVDASRPPGQGSTTAADLRRGTHLTGVIRTEGGEVVPGVLVTLDADGRRKSAMTSADGRFVLEGVTPGVATLTAQLEGFSDVQSQPRIRANRVTQVNLTLSLLAASETIVVTGELPSVLASSELSGTVGDEIDAFFADGEDVDLSEDFKRRAATLSEGLVAGVKPLPVTIPETGKAIHFAGFLPPRSVAVTFDVREPRR
ncbi:MAG: carboxypeptidase-like regulatory domain-containing protein, partial [Acidobacteriota bacterium]